MGVRSKILLLFILYLEAEANGNCGRDEVRKLGFSPEPSCKHPFPVVSIFDFKEGCYCKDQHVRWNGRCIAMEDCPRPEEMEHFELHDDKVCKTGEEWKIGYCPEPTCDNIFPILDYHDARLGCFCVDDHIRDSSGRCIPVEECPQYSRHKHVHICRDGEEYGIGGYPEPSCRNPHPFQYDEKTGCFCRDDYVRKEDGRCVRLDQCPSDERSPIEVFLSNYDQPIKQSFTKLRITPLKEKSAEPNRKDGGVDYEIIDPNNLWRCDYGQIFEIDWFRCKCNPTGLSASCVLDMNHRLPISEEYRCSTIERICGKTGPFFTEPTPLCRFGIYCKDGYARNANGKCVPYSMCPNSNKR